MSSGLQWFFGVCSFLALLFYLIEKGPRLYRYLTSKSEETAVRNTKDLVIGSLLALGCAFIWAMSYSSLGFIKQTTSTLEITTSLFGFAALFYYILSIIVMRRGNSELTLTGDAWKSGRAHLLVLANIGNFLLSVAALSYISASQANAINHFSPLILAGVLIVKGKLKPNLYSLLSLILVVLGIWVINVDKDFNLLGADAIIGSLISLLAGVSFAAWGYLIDEFETKSPSTPDRLRFLSHVFFGSYIILLTWVYFSGVTWTVTTENTSLLALNGVRVALVYLLFSLAIKKAGALLPSVIVIIQIPMTFYFDAILNDTSITAQLWIGSILIIVAAIGVTGDELQRAKK